MSPALEQDVTLEQQLTAAAMISTGTTMVSGDLPSLLAALELAAAWVGSQIQANAAAAAKEMS